MNGLLQKVLDDGWNNKRRKQFIDQYGALIRGNILYHLRFCFGGSQIYALGQYLKSLQKQTGSRIKGGISGKQLELVQDTWEEVFVKVFCEDKRGENLIQKWAAYVEEKRSEGKKARDFESYLKGAVQIAFWKHLRKKKDLEEKVAMEPEEAQSWERDGEKEAVHDDISVENEVLVYWDRLLRCQKPNPDIISQDLIKINRGPQTVLTWACAKLKDKLSRDQREAALENLKAFMAFHCSQQGPKKEGSSAEDISSNRLTLEQVGGRYFRWEKDICEGIFQKSIRKDRVMQKIKDILLDSPYRSMIK